MITDSKNLRNIFSERLICLRRLVSTVVSSIDHVRSHTNNFQVGDGTKRAISTRQRISGTPQNITAE